MEKIDEMNEMNETEKIITYFLIEKKFLTEQNDMMKLIIQLDKKNTDLTYRLNKLTDEFEDLKLKLI